MKKILSLVLVLSLVLGTFSFAFADGHLPTDVVGEDSEEAVETLMALGVVDGYPDGTYKPEKTLTRAEMAKLLVEAQGYGDLAAGSTASFTDAQGHWAESYIGFAASMEIVLGYPDGTFKPNAEMTMDEAITMVVRALGYTDEGLGGTWPTNYKVKALDLGLTDDLSALSGGAGRGDVAILIYNALEATLVSVNSDGDIVQDEDGKTLLDKIGKKVDGEDEEGVMISYKDVYDEDDALDTVIDLTPYLYHTITYYENGDGEVAYVSDVDTDEFEGVLIGTDTNEITVEDADEEEEVFDITTAAAFLYNGLESSDDIDELDTDDTVEIKVVYDEDDVVQGVVVWQAKAWMIGNEYTDRRPTQLDGIKLPVDSDDDLDLDELTIEGDATTLEDIAEDDIVHIYSSDGTDARSDNPEKLKLVVVRDTFTGTLTEIDDTTYVIGGAEFKVSDYSELTIADSALGKTWDLYLDKDGKIFDVVESDDDVADEGYGVLVGSLPGEIENEATYSSSDENVITKEPTVQIFTSGGDLVVYNIDTDGIDLDDLSAAVDNDGLTGIDLGVTVVEDDTDEITVDLGSLVKKDLVEYELNSDGEIISLESAADVDVEGPSEYDVDTDDMTVEDFDVVTSTIVFVVDGDQEDWEVVDSAYAVDATTGQMAVDDDFEIIALTAETGLESTEETYGIVTNVAKYYDGDETVEKVTALVNGEEVDYITNGDFLIEDEDEVVEFSFDGELLKKVTTGVTTVTGAAVEIETVDTNRIRANDELLNFADNVAVYVVEYTDSNKDVVDSWTAEEVSYLRADDYVTLYEDTTGDVVVVIFDIDQADYPLVD